METTSGSEQDGGLSSGEDNSFEHSVDIKSHQISLTASDSSNNEQQQSEEQFTDPLNKTEVSTSEDEMQSNYPFIMPPSYSSMMMQGGGMASTSAPSTTSAATAFFGKNTDGVTTAGSPLNLQTGGQTDRLQFSAATAAVLAQTEQQRNAVSANLHRGSSASGSGSYPQAAHQTGAGYTGQATGGQGRFPGEAGSKSDYPPPPKRPLTPYMRYNRQMWESVKAANPTMGVCEISATIGRMWRELGPEEKQRHNDDYTLDKARYDEEIKAYLKATGLRSSDLVKAKPKKKPATPAAGTNTTAVAGATTANAKRQAGNATAVATPGANAAASNRPSASPNDHHQQLQQQQQQAAHHAQVAANHHQQQQLQALMGLPMSAGSLPIGMSVGFQNMAPMLSGFQQMWATAAAGQQYPGGLVNAAQLQELYGGMNGIEAPPPAHTQQPSVSSDVQASALYRYPQNFM